MKTLGAHAERDIPDFAVLIPIVYADQGSGEIELSGALEGETTITHIAFVLDRVEVYAHGSECTYKKTGRVNARSAVHPGALQPNAQGKRRRSTEGAQGTNTGHENAEGMACVGVRLTGQLGHARINGS